MHQIVRSANPNKQEKAAALMRNYNYLKLHQVSGTTPIFTIHGMDSQSPSHFGYSLHLDMLSHGDQNTQQLNTYRAQEMYILANAIPSQAALHRDVILASASPLGGRTGAEAAVAQLVQHSFANVQLPTGMHGPPPNANLFNTPFATQATLAPSYSGHSTMSLY
jgi:hypothetical protein